MCGLPSHLGVQSGAESCMLAHDFTHRSRSFAQCLKASPGTHATDLLTTIQIWYSCRDHVFERMGTGLQSIAGEMQY